MAANATLWGDTLTAQATGYSGVVDFNLGQFVFSLLFVLGLLLLLAWGVKRLRGWAPSGPVGEEAVQERVLFMSQFNAQQTLIVLESGKTVRCLILRGKQVELATEITGVRALANESPRPGGTAAWWPWGKNKSGKASFRDILFKSKSGKSAS